MSDVAERGEAAESFAAFSQTIAQGVLATGVVMGKPVGSYVHANSESFQGWEASRVSDSAGFFAFTGRRVTGRPDFSLSILQLRLLPGSSQPPSSLPRSWRGSSTELALEPSSLLRLWTYFFFVAAVWFPFACLFLGTLYGCSMIVLGSAHPA